MTIEMRNSQAVSGYKIIFSRAVVLCGLFAAILCLFLNIGDKKIIAILPLAYTILYVLFKNNRKYLDNISLSVINISAFCRYIIYPMIIAVTIANGGSYSFNNITVYLLVYELIGVFCVIEVCSAKMNASVTGVKFQFSTNLGIPNLFLLMSFFLILLFFPSLLTRFSISSDVIKSSGFGGIIEIIFTMGIWVLFVYLIVKLSVLKDNSRHKNNFGFFLAALVGIYYILFNSVSGSDVKRWQIISCGIAIVYLLMRVFATKKRLIVVCGIGGIGIAVLFGSFIKFGLLGTSNELIDYFLNVDHFSEYFGGLKNITKAIEIFDASFNTHGIRSTLTDIFSGTPVISALFDYDNYSTAAIFQNAMRRTDIICPLTAQSVAHFGIWGTPILAMLMTYLSMTFNSALNKTCNPYSAYVLIELVFFTSLFMELNTTIILGKVWIRLMFLILQFIDEQTKIKFIT